MPVNLDLFDYRLDIDLEDDGVETNVEPIELAETDLDSINEVEVEQIPNPKAAGGQVAVVGAERPALSVKASNPKLAVAAMKLNGNKAAQHAGHHHHHKSPAAPAAKPPTPAQPPKAAPIVVRPPPPPRVPGAPVAPPKGPAMIAGPRPNGRPPVAMLLRSGRIPLPARSPAPPVKPAAPAAPPSGP